MAGLVSYQEEVGTKVVDGVLEDIRLGMEVNGAKFNQRRVAQIKYLGEMYNYRIVESADIFKVSKKVLCCQYPDFSFFFKLDLTPSINMAMPQGIFYPIRWGNIGISGICVRLIRIKIILDSIITLQVVNVIFLPL